MKPVDPEPEESVRVRTPYPPLLLWIQGGVGAVAGALWGLVRGVAPEFVPLTALVGAVALPVALLMTPVHGSRGVRAFRFGLSLAVLLTLTSSFVTPEELRTLEGFVFDFFQFLIGGALFFFIVEPRGRDPEAEDAGA